MRSFKFNEKRAREFLPGLLAALAIFVFTGCASTGFDTEDLSAGDETTELSAHDKELAAQELKVSAINVVGEGDSVIISTNKTAEYTSFTLTNPERLVIDLPEANLYDVLDTVTVNNQFLKTINVVTYGGKEKIGRIILELQEGVEHEVRSGEEGLIIEFKHDPLVGMPEGFLEDDAVVVASTSSDVVLAQNKADEDTALVDTLDPATIVEGIQSFTEDTETVIQIVSDGAIGKYNTFELTDPARVVIDVWDVTNSTGLKVMRVDGTEIKDVRVGNHPDKVRFVIDLTSEEIPPYVITKLGDHITATFSPEQLGEQLASAADVMDGTETISDGVQDFSADPGAEVVAVDAAAEVAALAAEIATVDEGLSAVAEDAPAEEVAGVEEDVAALDTIEAGGDESAVVDVVSTEAADVAAEEVASVDEGVAALDAIEVGGDEALSDESAAADLASADVAETAAETVASVDEDVAALDTIDTGLNETPAEAEVITTEAEDGLDALASRAEEESADLNTVTTEEPLSDESAAVEVVSTDVEETAAETRAAVDAEAAALDNSGPVAMADTDTEIADALKVEKEAEAEAAAVREEAAVSTAETETPVMEAVQDSPAVQPISAGNNIKNIDYKKIGSKGFLTIETSAKPVYSVKKSNNGKTLVIDIADTVIGENFVRTLDATKLGTPVASISSYQGTADPAVTRILVDLASLASHSVIELDGTLSFVFEPIARPVARKAAVQAANGNGPVYTGKKIDLDMMDARITDILRLLAEVSNLNIIASDDVTGTISLRLRDVPWDQAFDIILKAKGLDKVKVGNVIRVAPASRISQERDAALAAVKASEKLEPLSIEFVPINYGNAEELAEHVKNVLSDRGSVTSETRTNTLIIKDIKKGIVAAQKLITHLDTAIPQVLIEARIVEAQSSFSRDLGVQWGVDYQTGGNVNANIFGSGTTTGQTPPSGTNPTFETRNGSQNFAVNLPATGSVGTLGALGFILGKAGQNPLVLDLRLSAGEQEGQLRTISRPRIVTMDNKEAKIEDGESVPFETTSASGTSTIFIDANLSLTVTPHITPDGSVLMKIKASKNSIGTFTTSSGEPSIVKKEASTEVLVHDGETTVIGGIISSDSNKIDSGIPYLKDIPLMGKLFRSKSTKESQKELLIFITPTIMKGDTAG